jgi:hypothetical protein
LRNVFEIEVKTIDGQVLEFPSKITFDCARVIGIGMSKVRTFDIRYCIVVRDIFLFRQGDNVFGSELFKSMDEFKQYMATACACCVYDCTLVYNGCALSYNGCFLTYSKMILTN